MAIDQLGIYNDALLILGERRLASLTEDREVRHRLDTIWAYDAREYCLEVVKPRFACTVSKLTSPTTPTQHGYDYQFALPTDYVALAGVFSDENLESRIERYIVEGRAIACDHAEIYVRYISDDAAKGLDFTLWTPSFAKVVSAYMAKELAPRTRPDLIEIGNNAFVEASKLAVDLNSVEEAMPRSKKPTTTLTEEWLQIYNEALFMCGHTPITSTSEDSRTRGLLDRALDTGVVNNALEDKDWYFAKVSDKVFYDPSLNPDWGYEYVFQKPDTMYRITGVFQDEYLQVPLKNYADEGSNIYCNLQEIYLEYIPNTYVSSPTQWPVYFRKLVAADLAVLVAPQLEGADVGFVVQRHQEIRSQALSNDASQNPPRRLATGSWVTARTRTGIHRRVP